MQAVYKLLSAPIASFNLSTRIGMAPLAFALAAVSGRRMIEIMWTGESKQVAKDRVDFVGQAKKRTDKKEAREIYTLFDADMFMEKLTAIRQCPAVADFDDVIEGYGELDSRSQKGRINAVLAKAFNPWVKKFFNDERRVYKDSRAIYARIAYERWFRTDPRWASVDEDVFFSELLGHDDESTQMHYKQFKLHNFSQTWKPETGEENARLAALQKLDDAMLDFARGDSGVKLHEVTKGIIAENPDAKITNSKLREYGFSSPLIRRYLEFAASALGQVVGENGQYQVVNSVPEIVINAEDAEPEESEDDDEGEDDDDDDDIENEELEIEEEAEPEIKKPERPRFGAASRNDNGEWVIKFEYAGQHYSWTGETDTLREAMIKAWATYQ